METISKQILRASALNLDVLITTNREFPDAIHVTAFASDGYYYSKAGAWVEAIPAESLDIILARMIADCCDREESRFPTRLVKGDYT